MVEKPDKSLDEVISEDERYPPEAFAFLHEGLAHAMRAVHGDEPGKPQHVTGQQLCHGLRDFAVERWGMLARTVLAKWNIHETLDFGNMVYLLIKHGHMKKTDEDSLDDFRDVYDFDEAFTVKDEFELKE